MAEPVSRPPGGASNPGSAHVDSHSVPTHTGLRSSDKNILANIHLFPMVYKHITFRNDLTPPLKKHLNYQQSRRTESQTSG